MQRSVIFGAKLEKGLGMAAYRTLLRSRLSNMDMATFKAHPHTVTLAGEHDTILNVLEESLIALHMGAFDLTYHLKLLCDFSKTLFARHLCKGFIHVIPLVFLTCCSVYEVVGSCRYVTAMKVFEPELCVGMFVLGCFFEDVADLLVAVFSCLLCIEGVFHTCLRFACECGLKAFFGLASFEFHIQLFFCFRVVFVFFIFLNAVQPQMFIFFKLISYHNQKNHLNQIVFSFDFRDI